MERIHETRPGDEQMAYGIQIVSMILIDAERKYDAIHEKARND